MSRLRANDVLNQAGTGPFNASEGLTVPAGKSITFTDASEPTLLNGTTLTTTVINADQINLEDNQKLRIGQNQDLEIYHDGLNSYIDDTGTGNLRLRSGTLQVQNLAGSKTSAVFNAGGGQELYYNNTKHFETDSTGARLVGSFASTEGWRGTESSANVLGGLAMPFSCGLNGRIALPPTNATMLFGGSEYNGDNTEGAAMPHAGKLFAATLHAENAVGDLTLRATLNGTQDSSYQMLFTSPTVSSPTVVQTFYGSPMTFAAGDRINFAVNYTTLTQLEVLTVTFFVKFD